MTCDGQSDKCVTKQNLFYSKLKVNLKTIVNNEPEHGGRHIKLVR